MDSSLRSFVMDEYMCKQRHDWPEGLKFPSQCLLSCMRSIRCAGLGGSLVALSSFRRGNITSVAVEFCTCLCLVS